MRWFNKACLLLLTLGLPTLALAATSIFEVDPGDKSIEWLGMIFGTVPTTPIVGKNPMFSNLVYIFNQAVFGLGIIVISYTAAMGAIHTAHEGQFLGKSWHPILVPLRAGIGILLLVPQGTVGYNYMQMFVMWFIVQGIGVANSMWTQVLRGNAVHGNIHTDTRKVDLKGAQTVVNDIVAANVCMKVINAHLDKFPSSYSNGVIAYHDRLRDRVSWGIDSSSADPECGSIDLKTLETTVRGPDPGPARQVRMDAFASSILGVQSSLEAAAEESLMNPQPNPPFMASTLVDAAQTLRATAIATAQDPNEVVGEVNKEAMENGWILAGSYYYQLTQNGVGFNMSVNFGRMATPSAAVKGVGSFYAAVLAPALANAASYNANALNSITTVETWDRAGTSIVLKPRNMSGQGGSIFAALFGSLFEDVTQDLMRQMTGGTDPNATAKEKQAASKWNNDPLVNLAAFGSNLVTITEQVFFAALGIAFGLWLISSPMSCLQPLGHTVNFILTIIMPIAILMISLLWTAGLTLGIYIPMIPYLVFTFCALSWMIMVIEAMLAAPLIALTLIVPSEDEIGKAGHAIIILLGIFLRPILMVLGFVLAIQLLIVAIGMLNAGFWATMLSATGGSSGVGVFGLIAILLLYASIALGMVHEAFSLIYLVPNKVMRWIGGGEGDDPMSKVKELKGSVQKGAGIGAGLMKSSLKAVKK